VKCGWSFDPVPLASYGTREASPPQRTVVEIQPDPFDRRQVARWIRAAYEIGCLVQIGAIAGACLVISVLALLGQPVVPTNLTYALLEVLAVSIGAGAGGYVVLLLVGA
jgi:hypothetical protein